MARLTFKALVLFYLPGVFLLTFDWSALERHFTYSALPLTFSSILGWALIGMGTLFFVVGFKKRNRREYENRAREKLKALKDKPLVYESSEPLTADDIRTLQRQFYSLLAVLIPFSLLPAAFLLFVDEASRVYILIFLMFWIAVTGVIGGYAYNNLTRIRKAGKKNVIRGIVTDRFMKHYVKKVHGEESVTLIPCLKIGDRELLVEHRMNWKYNVGDAVEFHFVEQRFFDQEITGLYFYHTKITGAGVMDGASPHPPSRLA